MTYLHNLLGRPDAANANPPDAVARAARERVAALKSLWEHKRGDRWLPARRDFDMPAVQRWVRNLEFIDVERGPDGGRRFRYRLVGTGINQIDGMEATGRYADEIFGDLYTSFTEHYHVAIDTAAPAESVLQQRVNRRGTVYLYCKLVLPLSSDGETVDMLMVYLEEVPGTLVTA